jgi:hypothetical protein
VFCSLLKLKQLIDRTYKTVYYIAERQNNVKFRCYRKDSNYYLKWGVVQKYLRDFLLQICFLVKIEKQDKHN